MTTKPGELVLAWAGGEHAFRLATYGQLRLLQQTCDAGPAEILQRLLSARWRVDDVREIIRIGLIGGGMAAEQAMALVKAAIDESANWMELAALAKAVLLAGLIAPPAEAETDAPGKPAAEEATAASTSPPSTAPAPPSDFLLARSTSSPRGNSPPASTAGTGATAASRP